MRALPLLSYTLRYINLYSLLFIRFFFKNALFLCFGNASLLMVQNAFLVEILLKRDILPQEPKDSRTEKVSQFETFRGSCTETRCSTRNGGEYRNELLMDVIRKNEYNFFECRAQSTSGKTQLRRFVFHWSRKTSKSVQISRGVQIRAIDTVIPQLLPR